MGAAYTVDTEPDESIPDISVAFRGAKSRVVYVTLGNRGKIEALIIFGPIGQIEASFYRGR